MRVASRDYVLELDGLIDACIDADARIACPPPLRFTSLPPVPAMCECGAGGEPSDTPRAIVGALDVDMESPGGVHDELASPARGTLANDCARAIGMGSALSRDSCL